MTALEPIRILLLEDSADDAELIQHALHRAGVAFVAQRVMTQDAFMRALGAFGPDVVLVDCVLPGFDGRSALRLARQELPDVPVIVVTGALVEDIVVRLTEEGARDYILKDRLIRLAPAIRAALREAHDARQRQVEQHAAEQLSAEMHAANRLLEQAGQAMSERLTSTNHELRTPLNAILGFADLLLANPQSLNPSQQGQVRCIREAGGHLLALVSDLLDLASLDAGKNELYSQDVDCCALLTAVHTTLRPLAQAKRLDFSLRLPGRPVTVTADLRKLRQIVMNLAGNAIKFTDAGAVTLELTGRQVSGRPVAEIAVSDTGIGIKPEHTGRLFRAFSRLERGRSEGTGLGLHLSQKLAQLMGGAVSLTSDYGKGSRFWVTLPLAAANQNDIRRIS
ncbi:MAG TPA: ATP-binding protein [Verrucomicrobiae bacterium]|nr:ATP-binding protein [Verrucomicrobiae bacterium]